MFSTDAYDKYLTLMEVVVLLQNMPLKMIPVVFC